MSVEPGDQVRLRHLCIPGQCREGQALLHMDRGQSPRGDDMEGGIEEFDVADDTLPFRIKLEDATRYP